MGAQTDQHLEAASLAKKRRAKGKVHEWIAAVRLERVFLMLRSDARKDSGLIRGLGLWAATAIVIGSMIGQSVFLVASDMSREVSSMWKVLVVWIVGGAIVLFGALCYAELGAALPEAGGDYIYLGRGIGPLWGFLFGWTSSMIMRPCSAAVIAAGLLRFVTPGKDSCWIVTLASNCRRMGARPIGSSRKSCLESAIQHIHN